MTDVDLASNSFGQNFNVTMTQMASAFASLINGGYYYEPHVVKQIQDENGNVIETKDPVLLRKTSVIGDVKDAENISEGNDGLWDRTAGSGGRL